MENINDILFKEMLEDKEIKRLAINLGKAINKKAEQIFSKVKKVMVPCHYID